MQCIIRGRSFRLQPPNRTDDCLPDQHAVEIALVEQLVATDGRLQRRVVALAADHQPGTSVDVEVGNHLTSSAGRTLRTGRSAVCSAVTMP